MALLFETSDRYSNSSLSDGLHMPDIGSTKCQSTVSTVAGVISVSSWRAMFVISSKCRQITRIFLPMGFMVVSAVDLLCVFGRSFVLSDEVTLLVQFGGNHCGVLALSV